MNFFDTMASKDQKHAEELLAKAIYSSGTPLAIVENKEWCDFLSFVRPTFKIPRRHDVSTKLLDKTYQNIMLEVDQKINDAKILGLQIDGFSNIRNEGIINIILTTPDPVLYRSIDSGTNSQDGDYIAELISEAIDNIGPAKFLSICTDNAAACKKVWKIVEEKYKDHFIVCYGCVAHILNLLVKDILNQPSANLIFKNAISITKEIKYSYILAATFAVIQKSAPLEKRITISLKIPGKTRWVSSINCLESLSINEQNLNQLAISECKDKLKILTRQLLLSSEIWIQIKNLIKLLKPFIICLQRTESNDTKISQIQELFSELSP